MNEKIVNSIYDVYSGKLPCSFDGMKIAMLSDLHDNVYGISLEKLYGMIVEQEPELVIVAGDLLTRKHSDGSDEVVGLLKRLADRYPVFLQMETMRRRSRYIQKSMVTDTISLCRHLKSRC